MAARSGQVAAQKAEAAAKAGIVLKDCLTPGTECFKLSQQSANNQRAYFNQLVQAVGVCLFETPSNLSTVDPPAYEKLISECVVAHTPPNPITTTTTTPVN